MTINPEDKGVAMSSEVRLGSKVCPRMSKRWQRYGATSASAATRTVNQCKSATLIDSCTGMWWCVVRCESQRIAGFSAAE